nr:hypothetical protein [Tanacetum cinerariifolium]
MVSALKYPLTFDEIMDTPIDFSKAPVKVALSFEYNMEEFYKALSDRLDWENPKGDRCVFDLSKPLPLKGHPGHLTIALEYVFNIDLEYLKSTDSERKYTTSITKIKDARYELVGPKRQLFYKSQLNRFSKHDVYSPLMILSEVSVKVNKLHGYGYLEEIVVRRVDHQLFKFKEGDFVNLHMNEIEDMLLLFQHKLFHLDGEVIVDLAVALRISLEVSSLRRGSKKSSWV